MIIIMADVAVVALATLFVWVLASQLDTPIIRPVQRWLRSGWRFQLVGCPYCFGFWLSIIFTALVQWERLDWVRSPLTVLAATALAGFLGSLTEGAVPVDED